MKLLEVYTAHRYVKRVIWSCVTEQELDSAYQMVNNWDMQYCYPLMRLWTGKYGKFNWYLNSHMWYWGARRYADLKELQDELNWQREEILELPSTHEKFNPRCLEPEKNLLYKFLDIFTG